jgi:hypothetical protein
MRKLSGSSLVPKEYNSEPEGQKLQHGKAGRLWFCSRPGRSRGQEITGTFVIKHLIIVY